MKKIKQNDLTCLQNSLKRAVNIAARTNIPPLKVFWQILAPKCYLQQKFGRINFLDLVKFVMCTLVSSYCVPFCKYTKHYMYLGFQSTHDNLNKINFSWLFPLDIQTNWQMVRHRYRWCRYEMQPSYSSVMKAGVRSGYFFHMSAIDFFW